MAITIDEFLHDLTERQLLSVEEAHAVRRRMTNPLPDSTGQRVGSQRREPGTIPAEPSTTLAHPARLVLCESVIQNTLQADESHLIFSALRIRDQSPVTIHVLVPGQGIEVPLAAPRLNGSAPQSKDPPAHPHGITDVGRHGEMLCVCCEPLNGETLEQVVSQNGSLPLELATETLVQTARTLKQLEERGLCIGEVSPDVLLLDEEGRIHLTGLHLARLPKPGHCQCSGEPSTNRLHLSLGRLYAYLQTARAWSLDSTFELALPADGPPTPLHRSAKLVLSRLMGREAAPHYPGWDELIGDLECLLNGREISLPMEPKPRDVAAPVNEPTKEPVAASAPKNNSIAVWVTVGLVMVVAVVVGAIKFLAD